MSWSSLIWRWNNMDRVPLERKVLSENDRLAAELRARFLEHGVLCLNIISSPGSGKTSLLERTLETLPRRDRVAVLTGDIQTENDADRLKRFHFPVKQITTGGTCHLEGGPAHRFISLLERFTSSGLETSIASSGLATACRWRRDRCRYSAVSPMLAWPTISA